MKEIPLTQGKVALVDNEDFEYLNQWKWYYSKHKDRKTGYATKSFRKEGKANTLSMHRLLLNASKEQMVDHINHNGLDNRKHNIRLCTPHESACNREKQINNSSGVKGVDYFDRLKKWRVRIQSNNKQFHIGVYPTKEMALLTYNEAALKHHGSFALIN